MDAFALRARLNDAWRAPELHCPLPTHGAGHVCVPSDAEDLAELERVAADVVDGPGLPVRAWVVGGTAAGVLDGPPVGGDGGLPIGGEGGLLELRGWVLAEHWFGYGVTATADGPCRVAFLARRAFTRPPGVGWVELLREVTEWTEPDRRGVDWAATEAALGTALPGDYKDIVDAFGAGSFDEYLGDAGALPACSAPWIPPRSWRTSTCTSPPTIRIAMWSWISPTTEAGCRTDLSRRGVVGSVVACAGEHRGRPEARGEPLPERMEQLRCGVDTPSAHPRPPTGQDERRVVGRGGPRTRS